MVLRGGDLQRDLGRDRYAISGFALSTHGTTVINYLPLFQGVGMMVAVYGLAYYYLARDPERYANLVWVGILGKSFGPIGFAWALLTGKMALALFWPFMFNDIIWLPAFISFALRYARDPLLLKR
jgi:small multidrug resistance pump